MAFSTYFHLSKPEYKVLRYDEEINADRNILEAALLNFPSASPPGSATNFPDVIPTNGMMWLDLGNEALKMYYSGSWVTIKSLI